MNPARQGKLLVSGDIDAHRARKVILSLSLCLVESREVVPNRPPPPGPDEIVGDASVAGTPLHSFLTWLVNKPTTIRVRPNDPACFSFVELTLVALHVMASRNVMSCRLASRPDFVHIWNNPFFWKRVMSQLKDLTEAEAGRCVACSGGPDGRPVPGVQAGDATHARRLCLLASLVDVSSMIMHLFQRMPDTVGDPAYRQVVDELARLADHIRTFQHQGDEVSRLTAAVTRGVDLLLDMSKSVRSREEILEEELERVREAEDRRLAIELTFSEGTRVPREEEPLPGELHPDGPRHDNDKSDFREISAIPSADETKCDALPYLPLQLRDHRGSGWIADPVDRHLDIQFRLTRQDAIAAPLAAVRAYLDGSWDGASPRFQVPHGKGGSYTVDSFRGADIVHLMPGAKWSAPSFTVEFDHPTGAYKKAEPTAKEAEEYWTRGRGARVMQTGSLIILAFGLDVHLAVVLDRRSIAPDTKTRRRAGPLLKVPRPRIGVSPLGHGSGVHAEQASIRSMVQRYMATAGTSKLASGVLLQVRGHFFANTVPTLSALQDTSLTSLPLLRRLVPPRDGEPAAEIRDAPITLDDPTIDLGVLLKANSPPEVQEALDEVPLSQDGILAALMDAAVRPYVTLDENQSEALALALTKEVSLIQGPPGTGKTYVGVRIVQTILANATEADVPAEQLEDGVRLAAIHPKMSLAPVVCVCFTNHALDQFLEDLVNSGAVKLDDVVRVGGRTKSSMMMDRSLRSLTGTRDTDKYIVHSRSRALFASAMGDIDKSDKEMSRVTNQSYLCSRARGLTSTAVKNAVKLVTEVLGEEEITELIGFEPDEEWEVAGGLAPAVTKWFKADPEKERQWTELVDEARKDVETSMVRAILARKEAQEKIRHANMSRDLAILRSAKVIGMTTSGAAMNASLLQALNPRVVVCEEAGEVMESHILAALTQHTEMLILIGDHMQLRPKPSEYRLSADSGNGFNLDVSLFERMIREHEDESVQLLTQRRMRPCISDLIRRPLYKELRDDPSVADYPGLRGSSTDLHFFDHSHRESQPDGLSSYVNMWEAKMIVALARYFVRQGYGETEIAILTPYVGQLLAIRQMLSEERLLVVIDERDAELIANMGRDDDDDDPEAPPHVVNTTLARRVRLATVDNFQGEEADVVLVSTVRNNRAGRTGFLKVTNRVNVMLSRARHGMIVLGSSETIRKSSNAFLFHSVLHSLDASNRVGSELLLRCEGHGRLTSVTEPAHVPHDGGCDMMCDAKMQCGHACERMCHPDDADHTNTSQCRKPCVRLAPCNLHPCVKLCNAPCVCREKVPVELLCGHEMEVACSEFTRAGDSQEAMKQFLEKKGKGCREMVGRVVMDGCGHVVEEISCADYSSGKCPEACGVPLGCLGSHECTRMCHQCAVDTHGPTMCDVKCDRTLMCGHTCNAAPCHTADDCPPCRTTCTSACTHSRCRKACSVPCTACSEPCPAGCTNDGDPHVPPCTSLCGLPCSRTLCAEPCDKTLSCGHACPSICGEKCPDRRWCPECARGPNKAAAAKTNASAVVDVFAFDTLADMDEEARLIVLGCGHAFTMETLDGATNLAAFFDMATGEPRPLDDIPREAWSTPFRCPSTSVPCSRAISGTNRYRRPVALATLALSQRKWKVAQGMALAKEEVQVHQVLDGMLGNSDPTQLLGIVKQKRGEIDKVTASAIGAAKVAQEESPTRDVFGKLQVQKELGPNMLHRLVRRDVGVLAASVSLRVRATTLKLISIAYGWQGPSPNGGGKKKKGREVKVPAGQCKLLQSTCQAVVKPTIGVLVELNGLVARRAMTDVALALISCLSATVDLALHVCPQDRQDDVNGLKEKVVEWIDGDIFSQVEEEVTAKLDALREQCRQAVRMEEVTDEERLAILRAMEHDVGSGMGSFGGHWYQCQCGYEYAIGECGGASVERPCPACGATIGGQDHVLAAGNTQSAAMLHLGGHQASPSFRADAERHLM
jgi:hypothetical protein